MCPTTTLEELCHIAIIKEWAKGRPFLVHLKVLLGDEDIEAYLPPIGPTNGLAEKALPEPSLRG